MSDFSLEDIVSLCKRRGFIFPGSEIYGGLSGTWDYGPLGAKLKRNIINKWLKFFVDGWDDMYLIDTAILMSPKVWQASGHIDTFSDPMIEDVLTKKRYRLDQLLEGAGVENVDHMSFDQMVSKIQEKQIKSPEGNKLGNPAKFNLMFKTHIGVTDEEASISYLRPETAQGMFVNFKNIVDTFNPDLPFGIAQVGRVFRNEISPRDFIFRVRELELMELEYFVKPDDWEKAFEKWRSDIKSWLKALGIDDSSIKEVEVPEEDRAHYSKRSLDFYFKFPTLGFDEIAGLAYRTDFDLKSHQDKSGKNLEYRPKDDSQPFIPHVLEPTFGLDRHVLAVLCDAYSVDEINGDKRLVLKLRPDMAPFKVAVSPLLKNKKELVDKARSIFNEIKKITPNVAWDDNGNIGKRYRRHDEIGTPYFVTIDFSTLEDDTVTVRDRDTTAQQRMPTKDLNDFLTKN